MTMPRNNGIAHVAFDHEDSLRSHEFIISWLTPTPHARAVYASCSASPPPHATLASRRPATLLRARHERPSGRAADKRDEVAPSHAGHGLPPSRLARAQ